MYVLLQFDVVRSHHLRETEATTLPLIFTGGGANIY